MRRMRAAAGLLLALPLLVTTAAPALATTPGDVADSLRSDPVYVDEDVPRGLLDEETVRQELRESGLDAYVAVLPAAAARANGGRLGVNGEIGRRLGDDAVLITVVGSDLTGGAGCGVGLGAGEADRLVRQSRGNLDSRVLSAIDRLDRATDSGRLASGCTGSGGGLGGAGLAVLGLAGVGAAGGLGYLVVRSRRRAARANEEDRADVQSLYDRLGSDVMTLSPGDDPVAQQALADAAERYNATGAAMAVADTPGEWAAARRTAVEGLTAARRVRAQLGLDLGPEVPPPPGVQGPHLQERSRVRVGEDEHEGTPDYEPGHPHYYGGGTVGGQQVPGGWYPSRFWEGMLLGGILSGGFGGGFGGGSYGGSYGGDDGGRRDGGGSGDWGGGGSSGGDWGGSGSGGGDGGGSGGGGSW